MLELAGAPGTESIYAVAFSSGVLADAFTERIKDMQSLCGLGAEFPGLPPANHASYPGHGVQRWQAYLEHLAFSYPGQVEWRKIEFRHVAYRGQR